LDKAYESVTTPFDIDAPDEWIMALEVSGKFMAMCSIQVVDRTDLTLPADLGYSRSAWTSRSTD